jgi:hypothetical protein
MKTMLLSLVAVGAGFSLIAADAKQDLQAAVKKLSEKGSYTWTSKSEFAGAPGGGGGGGNRLGGGTLTGKTDKDGLTWFSQSGNNNTIEAAKKGDKSAVKTQDGWKSSEELQGQGGGGQGGGRGGAGGAMMGRMLTASPLPASQLEGIVAKAKEVKAEADGLYVVTMTEEGAKEFANLGRGGFGGRQGGLGGGGQGGGNRPEPRDAKASAKVWVKDGVPTKYELTTSSKMMMRDEEREIGRTTTIEFKDVGATKVELPDEAKGKL